MSHVPSRSANNDASAFVPAGADLSALRTAASGCRGCELYKAATQTVFGDGPESARLVIVGEQPGDREDTAGEPFVGPAGRLLDKAMDEAGVDRSLAYVTNAIKHFKFRRMGETGKRRIHQKPSGGEVRACRPWLNAELALIRPEVVVVLGATAAQALLGSSFRVTRHRGELIKGADAPYRDLPEDLPPPDVVATVHPSSVLRADDREAAYRDLVADMRSVAAALG